MAKKFNLSQFNNQMRQQINKYNQEVNKINREINRQINDQNRNIKQAIDKYNQAVRQHNAKVLQNRSRIQNELHRLNSSSRITITTTYRTSIMAMNTSYRAVSSDYDYLSNPTPFQDYVYSGIEQENANSLETANVLTGEPQPVYVKYSLQDTKIMNQLSNISADLDNRWKGALFSLNPVNPDATRHLCTSTREIITEIIDSKAKDQDVFALFPTCEKTERGNATRKVKIGYFLHKKGFRDENIEDFIEKDIDNILELFHLLNTGTHGEAGRYTFEKLSAIKKRVEDGLIFLCNIAS